jgi:cell division protein FtsL
MSNAVSRAIPRTFPRPLPRVGAIALERPRLLPLLAFIALVMGLSLFFVWSRLQVVNLEYDISSLEGRLREMQQQTQRLKLEAASLRNPERIEALALNELGLRQPGSQQVITVK